MTRRAGMRCVTVALALCCAAQAQAQVQAQGQALAQAQTQALAQAPTQASPAARASAAPGRNIPFKQEEDFAAHWMRVGIGLVLALGVGAAALAGYRRLHAPRMSGRRMRLLETLRLGPKSTLFLVDLDGRTLLIGQDGDALAVLERQTPPQAN